MNFSKTASRIAPSSTENASLWSAFRVMDQVLTKEDGKDSAFDAQYGGVQVLPIAIDVQFHVVIREAKHIAFLNIKC